MSQYFLKPYETFSGGINVKVDLSNYATKTDLKNVSHVDVSSFALKSNLASLKTEVDKLDIDKLVPAPNDLVKLIHVVKMMLSKRLNTTNLSRKLIILLLQILLKKPNMKKMDQILKIKSIRQIKNT